MSYKAKPEDISANLAGDLYGNISGVTLDAARHNIAAILNAAIEAGLVSPPCWCMRERGELWKHDIGREDAMLFPVPDPKNAYGPRKTEHWKGQTE